MPPILHGLLDADVDLRILSLSLLDTKTHASLTHLSLVRPFSPSPPSSTQSKHQTRWLWIPPLRIPWASPLAQLLSNHLHIHLVPLNNHHDDSNFLSNLPSLLSTLSNPTYDSVEWSQVVESFYTALPPAAQKHNHSILKHISHVAIQRLATCARLAFINSLITSLSNIARESTLFLSSRFNHCSQYKHKHQHTDHLDISCRRRKSSRRTPRIVVRAHLLPSSRSSSSDKQNGALVHGVVIRTDILSMVCDIIRSRYNIEITLKTNDINSNHIVNNIGTLSSLSNRGTALLPHSSSEPHTNYKSTSALVSSKDGEKIDEYLNETFGTTWRNIISRATKQAEQIAFFQTEQNLNEFKQKYNETVELRESFIQHAIELDVAGESLAKISAMSVVRAGLVDEVEERMKQIYSNVLQEARGRIELLNQKDCRHAAKLALAFYQIK